MTPSIITDLQLLRKCLYHFGQNGCVVLVQADKGLLPQFPYLGAFWFCCHGYDLTQRLSGIRCVGEVSWFQLVHKSNKVLQPSMFGLDGSDWRDHGVYEPSNVLHTNTYVDTYVCTVKPV